MFICDECHGKMDCNCLGLFRSRGPCELCGKVGHQRDCQQHHIERADQSADDIMREFNDEVVEINGQYDDLWGRLCSVLSLGVDSDLEDMSEAAERLQRAAQNVEQIGDLATARLKEMGRLNTLREGLQRQLDIVDRELAWDGTGRGRLDTIHDLKMARKVLDRDLSEAMGREKVLEDDLNYLRGKYTEDIERLKGKLREWIEIAEAKDRRLSALQAIVDRGYAQEVVDLLKQKDARIATLLKREKKLVKLIPHNNAWGDLVEDASQLRETTHGAHPVPFGNWGCGLHPIACKRCLAAEALECETPKPWVCPECGCTGFVIWVTDKLIGPSGITKVLKCGGCKYTEPINDGSAVMQQLTVAALDSALERVYTEDGEDPFPWRRA
jgi:hypothetical protein